MVFPFSLCVVLSLLAIAFILSMATAVREKWREPGYIKIPASFGPTAAVGEFASVSAASFLYPAATAPVAGSRHNGSFINGPSIYSMTSGATNRDGIGVGSYTPNYSVIADDHSININAYNNMAHQRPSSASYNHNASSPHYALPTATTQNEMTYCVIDGRLVDN
jgi:hypothetical protein